MATDDAGTREKIMWFTRRRKRNAFLGRKNRLPDGQNAADGKKSTAAGDEESPSDENSAKMNPERKTPGESAARVNPSEQTKGAEEENTELQSLETENEQPKESKDILSGENGNGQRGEDKKELPGEDKKELSEEDENERSGGTENVMPQEKNGEKKDDPEAEKDENLQSDPKRQEIRRNKAHGKKQRSLYEWRREKPVKSAKPVKAVKKTVRLKNGVILGEGLPKICVPLTGTGKTELEEQAREAVAVSPDLVEWRADYFGDLGDVEKIAEVLMSLQEILDEIPILFTIRTKREGGKVELTPEEYRSLLLYAAGRPEVSLVDIEGLHPEINTELLISEVHELGMPVIASWHSFSRTPKKPELDLVFDRLARTGADVLKVAVMPKKPKDVLRLMSVTEEKNRQIPSPLVTMAMGDLGRLSRVSGKITGSVMTFGTVGDASAPGQLPVRVLREMIRTIG